jgi:hypothetical protein
LGGAGFEVSGRKVIAMAVREEAIKLTLRQREGRAINAVAELLRRTLSVPNIYLEPPATLIAADVLAVDRAGAGDLHAVEIKLEHDLNPSGSSRKKVANPKELNELYSAWYPKYRQKLHAIHRQLMLMPAHYRYLAIPAESFTLVMGELGRQRLFAEDGIGSLGVIVIGKNGTGSPSAKIEVAPERFRVDAVKLQAIETKLLAKSRPDIEVRI